MPAPRLVNLAVLASILPACTTNPVDPPPQIAVPPLVEIETRIREDTITVTSAVTAGGESLTDHRLLLNGVVVRSGPVLSWTIRDTVLPSGNYTFTAEATAAGGQSTQAFPFLIREVLPPSAQSLTLQGDEAGAISVNMLTVTSGALDRHFTFDPPPTVVLERTGASTIRVRAAADGNMPADDVHGAFEVPYTVTDQRGSASGVLQFNFRPQPDITITAIRFLTGEPVSESVRIVLNNQVRDFTVGSRVQARTGDNVWELTEEAVLSGLVGRSSYVGLQVEGQGEEVPLNRWLSSETMSLGSNDLGAELVVLGTTYPGFDAACRSSFESVYQRIHADTVETVNFIVLTQAGAGREAIEVGGQSFVRWREAFDSLVAEEERRALQMNRDPRTFIFTTDLETEPRRVVVHSNILSGQPAAGQVWISDTLPPSAAGEAAAGGKYSVGPAGDVVSGAAWSTPSAPVPNRRMALAKWFDRTPFVPENPACSRHRGTYGPDVANTIPHPIEAALVPLLQARANWMLVNRGQGLMIIK